MRTVLALVIVHLLAPAPLPAANLTQLGHAPLSGYTNDLFVHDNLAFVMNREPNPAAVYLYIFDVTDPTAPTQLSRTLISTSAGLSDMHGIYYSNGFIYVGITSQSPGIHILDVTNPALPRPVSIAIVLGGTHNLRLAGDYLYVLPNSGVDMYIYDVSDPTQPGARNQFDLSASSYCHDLSVMDGIGYASMWDNGLFLLDLSDPLRFPLPIITRHAPANPQPNYLKSTHSAWLMPDRRHVLTCHESNNIGMNSFDVTSNPIGAPLYNYQSHELDPVTMIHDVFIVGRYAYISYYSQGVRVVDTADPSNLVEVASFSVPWQAYAIWAEEGLVYTTDSQNGLYIFSFDLPHPAPITLYAVKSGAGRDVSMEWNYTGESQYSVRRSTIKSTIGPTHRDVDGATRWADSNAVTDANRLFFYKINGPWR